MISQDESFEPNCKKCKDAYGFIELMPENRLAVELFSVLNSSIVIQGKLQQIIWERYSSQIEDEGFDLVFKKLNEISTYVDDYKREKEEAQRRQAEMNAKIRQTQHRRR